MSKKTRRSLYKKILQMGNSGRLLDTSRDDYEVAFYGSIDRYSIIANALHGRKKVLDIGAGNGLLLAILHELGHECYALDWTDAFKNKNPEVYLKRPIVFKKCFIEIDPFPFEDNFFDAVTCCQVLEHFTHSHLHAIKEIYRILKSGGLAELDVPNAADLRNRLRLLRGKHITWDYERDYLYKEPKIYKNHSFFDRHNREFTKNELETLLNAGGFRDISVRFLKSARYRTGLSKIKSLGSALRDVIPSFRKSIIGFGIK
ncbi:methyltransferase domain-containing protein [Thermodesulfobacteriota bacterium]